MGWNIEIRRHPKTTLSISRTKCLAGGLPLRGCVRAGISCCDIRQQKRLKRAEKNKSLRKGAVMQARAPNWDLAAVESEGKASMLSLFKQRRGGAPPA